jgi:hypothetical protein
MFSYKDIINNDMLDKIFLNYQKALEHATELDRKVLELAAKLNKDPNNTELVMDYLIASNYSNGYSAALIDLLKDVR